LLGIKSKLSNKSKNLPTKLEKQSPAIQTKKTTAPKEKISKEKDDSSDIYAISYRYFSKRAAFLFPRLIKLEKNLKVAGMPIHYEAYVCMMVLVSIISGIIFGVIGVVVSLLVNISPAALGVMLPIFLLMIGMQGTFGMAYMYPSMNAKGRASKIIHELPYYIGYMATLTASGLGIEGVFKAIAREQSKEERECKK